MSFRVLTPAREELVAAAEWYESKTEGLGIDFIDVVEKELAAIESDPYSFPLWELNVLDAEIRRVFLQRFGFLIYYQVIQDEVIVLTICHGSRNDESWIKRVRRLDW